MSQQQEQNKTAKQWLKDRGFVVETVEQSFDFDRQAQQLEEYASQQTASLQKQHREESVKLIRRVREFYQNDMVDLRKQLEGLQAFKNYVHKRLDDMGIPVDPDSPHKDAGCRIGGRLDVVEKQVEEQNKRYDDAIERNIDKRERIAQLEEALKKMVNATGWNLIPSDIVENAIKALNPQDNQK